MTDPKSPRPDSPRPVAAFFDLDKTLIATSSALAFSRQMINRNLITVADAARVVSAEAIYMVLGHTDERMEKLKNDLMVMIDGWKDDEVRDVLRQALHEVITPTIYAEATELLDWHRALGHDLILISASPHIIVEPVAELLGIDTTVATRLGMVDGVYNGTIDFYCKGDNKAVALRRLAAERGYDLSQCYAYSDSIIDLPMLETVGNAVAVNPDKALSRIAVNRHWRIRHFRHPLPGRQWVVRGGLALSAVAAGGTTAALIHALATARRR
ncbi:HAD family hydrolase [Corynebacterium mendelii]|uniref:HAD-IB family hydrolase n=1 Tax=Corynebacterium mendelii TaxID=2765362 RepID=A0A939DZ98_9CORY|nr:HAD-IB family hydrolase [Corynebacterium mendelii]